MSKKPINMITFGNKGLWRKSEKLKTGGLMLIIAGLVFRTYGNVLGSADFRYGAETPDAEQVFKALQKRCHKSAHKSDKDTNTVFAKDMNAEVAEQNVSSMVQ